jgi:hypothetical protein
MVDKPDIIFFQILADFPSFSTFCNSILLPMVGTRLLRKSAGKIK